MRKTAINNQLVRLDRIQKNAQTGQLVPTNTDLYNPGSWLIKGDSPAEIILASAILVSAIAGLLNVLMTSKQR
jgi:hypothetical protein